MFGSDVLRHSATSHDVRTVALARHLRRDTLGEAKRDRHARARRGGASEEEKPEGALHIVLHNIISVLTTEQAPKLGRFVHAIRSRPTINPGFDDSHSFMLSKLTGAEQECASDVNT